MDYPERGEYYGRAGRKPRECLQLSMGQGFRRRLGARFQGAGVAFQLTDLNAVGRLSKITRGKGKRQAHPEEISPSGGRSATVF